VTRYTDASKERAKDAADMVEIVGARVELKRAGTNRYVGLCPFHDERTPSFGINPIEKVYYCFGCQASGDLFSFVMETEGVDFKGALELVAQRSGVTLELEAEPAGAVKARRSRERQLATVDRAASFYAAHLWSPAGRRVLALLQGRGLEEAILREFRVGVAPDLPDGLISAARKGGVTAGDLARAGLTIAEGTGVERDRFRNRIMFPVADWSGKVVGFGARRLREADRAKYINSPASELFRKKELLFGATQARKHAAHEQASVFVEGYIDVLALHQADVRNTVAPMGTSVTEEQIAVLRRLAPTVILIFDGDSAGRAAALKAGRLAVAGGLAVKAVMLPAGTDPAEIAAAGGRDAVLERLATAVSFARFEVESAIATAAMTTGEEIDAFLATVRPILAALVPGALREELIGRVAAVTGFAHDQVADWLPGAPEPVTESVERQRLHAAIRDASLRYTLDPAEFSNPLLRRTAEHVRTHPDDPAGSAPRDDADMVRLLTLLVATA
jgi:DNA primase